MHLGGSALEVEQFEIIKESISIGNLIEQVASVAKTFTSAAARKNSSKITGMRNVGTMTWVNTASAKDA